MSLRTRLLATVIALLALICLIIGVATEVSLRSFLFGQVDTRLSQVSNPPNRHSADDDGYRQTTQPPFCDSDVPSIIPPGQAGTLRVQTIDGELKAQVLDATGCSAAVPAAQTAVLAQVPVDNAKHTVDLGPLGEYRVMATRDPYAGRVVTGLPLSDVEDTLNQLILVEILVALGGLLLAGSVGTAIVRRTLRPLRRVAATASRVSEMPLDKGDVALSVRVPTVDTDPRTEVGQVGAALNRMLGHVANALKVRQASEVRVRQFVADASHELRTPLAAIRGYAELSRRVHDDVPPDIAHAMRRVESETARMTALVEDLLLLARLDSGRPLAQDPVDLSQLVVDAVSDAHVAGPDHRWQLDLPDEPVVVTGDGARLHQVLANLLANARTHTPAGTEVTVSLATRPGRVELAVADNGPGIPENLLPDVFDRFARADTSRSRAAGSTGLGLAIVAAVVENHHGSVSVDSRPGRTVFTVTLPVEPLHS